MSLLQAVRPRRRTFPVDPDPRFSFLFPLYFSCFSSSSEAPICFSQKLFRATMPKQVDQARATEEFRRLVTSPVLPEDREASGRQLSDPSLALLAETILASWRQRTGCDCTLPFAEFEVRTAWAPKSHWTKSRAGVLRPRNPEA